MNILLVYPKYPDTFWSFKHALEFVSKKAAFPPLGLLTVAAMLPKKWKKKLVDTNARELKNEDIAWADVVFISAMIIQNNSAQEIINRCKAQGKTVVAGGPAFIAQHQRFKGVDHFVLNEAEVTLPVFLKDLKHGKAKKIYTSKVKPDVTQTPVPLWPLLNFSDYATMSVQYSRGCPFNCEFCDIVIMNGGVPRTKNPNQLLNELQMLYQSGWRGSVFMSDDNFIGNKTNVKKLLPLLIAWQKKHKYPFKLFTQASINLADDSELMSLMSEANFYKVFLGIETPIIESLNECGKIQNAQRDLGEAIGKINKNGLQVMGGFIVGFDHDPENVFDIQIEFIQQTGVVAAMVGVLTAFPKTRLWSRLKAEGRLLGNPTGEPTDGNLNFIPKMPKEKLTDGYEKIISTIYSPEHYYRRINTFINDYMPTVRSRTTSDDLMAFFRSSWKIGVLSNERILYWKLLAKTLITKRGAFATAVDLAVWGQHFAKVTRRVADSTKTSPFIE